MDVHTKIGLTGESVHFCTPFTQYSPLVAGVLQSVDSCCLILLQELPLNDLVVPIDGDNLYI